MSAGFVPRRSALGILEASEIGGECVPQVHARSEATCSIYCALSNLGCYFKGSTHMLARLGNVLYWAACIIAVILVGIGIEQVSQPRNNSGVFFFFAVPALIIWAVGRALRYILADT
jgi:hypothetical protein